MYLYEDLMFVLRALYARFAAERASADWATVHLPAMRVWASIGGRATDAAELGP